MRDYQTFKTLFLSRTQVLSDKKQGKITSIISRFLQRAIIEVIATPIYYSGDGIETEASFRAT